MLVVKRRLWKQFIDGCGKSVEQENVVNVDGGMGGG